MSYKNYYLKVGIPKNEFAVIYKQALTSFKSYVRQGRNQHTFEDLLHLCILQYLKIKPSLNNDKTKLGYIKAAMYSSLAILFNSEKKHEDTKCLYKHQELSVRPVKPIRKFTSILPCLQPYERVFYANEIEKDYNIIKCISLHGLDCLRENGIGSIYGIDE